MCRRQRLSPWVGPRKIPTEFRGSFPAPLGDHCTISAAIRILGGQRSQVKFYMCGCFLPCFRKPNVEHSPQQNSVAISGHFRYWEHGSYFQIIYNKIKYKFVGQRLLVFGYSLRPSIVTPHINTIYCFSISIDDWLI